MTLLRCSILRSMKAGYRRIAVVTGGAGFVGTALCRRLVAEGYAVIALDSYAVGSRDNHVHGVEYREGHTKNIAALIPETPELLYHLGEYSRVEKSFEDPFALVWDWNMLGTYAVLEYWKQKRCKLMYAGSSTKFGTNEGGTIQGKSMSPYAWTKGTNTELVSAFAQWYDLPYAITYFYNVYGPGEMAQGPYATVVAIFLDLYARGRPLMVVQPGTQRRNFTHIEDIVEGLWLVGQKGQGEDYGIGSDESYSISELAGMFPEAIIHKAPMRKGNRMNGEVRSQKVRALGWVPKHGLGSYIAHQRGLMSQRPTAVSSILVFSTSFPEVLGPAEQALVSVARALPDIHFDVVTTAGNSPEYIPENMSIIRSRFSGIIGKLLFPLEGAYRARRMAQRKRYAFVWGIMASYAGLAAALYKRRSYTPLLISLANQDIAGLRSYMRIFIALILRSADQVSAVNAEQDIIARRVHSGVMLTASRTGDSFANQVRFIYNAYLKELLIQAGIKLQKSNMM
jgi:UDP-glucose 4-epimerase